MLLTLLRSNSRLSTLVNVQFFDTTTIPDTIAGIVVPTFVNYSDNYSYSYPNAVMTYTPTLGNLLIAFARINSTSGWSGPNGWIKIDEHTTDVNNYAVFWKIATAADVSANVFTFSLNFQQGYPDLFFIEISGADTQQPFDMHVENTNANVTVTAITSAITPTVFNTLPLALIDAGQATTAAYTINSIGGWVVRSATNFGVLIATANGTIDTTTALQLSGTSNNSTPSNYSTSAWIGFIRPARVVSTGLTRSSVLGRVATDTFVTSDSVPVRSVILPRSRSEVLTTSDVLATKNVFNRAVSDTLPALSDAISRVELINRVVTDAFATSDTLARSITTLRAITDAQVTTDAILRTVLLARLLTDVGTVTDVLGRSLIVIRLLTDARTTSDSTPVATLGHYIILADTFVTGDSLARVVGVSRGLTDAQTTSDVLLYGRLVSRTTTDTLPVLADSVSRIASFARSAADAFTTVDVLTRAIKETRVFNDAFTLSDALTKAILKTVLATDTFATSDALLRSVQLVRNALDVLPVLTDLLTLIATHYTVYNVQYRLLSAQAIDEKVGNVSAPTVGAKFIEPLVLRDSTPTIRAHL